MRKSPDLTSISLPLTISRILLIILTLLLIFVLASCTGRKEAAPPTFYLSKLPELEPFEMLPEIAERYGGIPYANELVPRDDYGKLYPYIGKVLIASYDDYDYDKFYRYGLCDEKGRVVVDPVYEDVYYPDDEKNYLVLSYPREKIDPTVTDVRNVVDTHPELIVVKADGSRIVGKFSGNYASISEDRLIIHAYGKAGGLETSEIYDLEGRLILKADGYFYGFYEGLCALPGATSDGQYLGWGKYVDKDGHTVIQGPFVYAKNFSSGRATVAIAGDETAFNAFSEKYGVIDRSGDYLIEPIYDRIEVINNDGQAYYIFRDDFGFYGVIGDDGEIIIPARYARIDGDSGSDIVIAADAESDMENRSFYVINLISGEEKQIAGAVPEGETEPEQRASYAGLMGDGWYKIQYAYSEALVLVNGDNEYRFDAGEGEYLDCTYIKEDLFEISYHGRESVRTEIFDGASGETVKTFDGLSFVTNEDPGVMLFWENVVNPRFIYVFNENFEPQFSAETLGGSVLTQFNHLTCGVCQVRTAFSSGLLKEDGEWLVRVNVSGNTD